MVENQIREGYQIEYKRAVTFREKQDRLDFLASVASYANTVGGDLLIGVDATRGVPVRAPGWEGVDVDQEELRIENLLRDQVEPRFSFKVREIRLSNGNDVVLLRVPWSWAQPHMVRMDQVNRFYYRHSAGKDIMNVSQLRAAFALTSRLDRAAHLAENSVRTEKERSVPLLEHFTGRRVSEITSDAIRQNQVKRAKLVSGRTVNSENAAHSLHATGCADLGHSAGRLQAAAGEPEKPNQLQ